MEKKLIDPTANNKRIAKNTILLYIRMLLLLVIGLYTSRVVLSVLGVENYGIINVIAGFLTMFSFLTGSLSNAISRYITVGLGGADKVKLKNTFSTSFTVQLLLGVFIIVLIETFGLWFVNTKLNIPAGREEAALWCLHCSALSTFVSLLSVPLNATIIAHEKMSAFAYISLLEASLKLLICYALMISPIDKLVTYVILGVCVSLSTTSIYWYYGLKHFDECTLKVKIDRGLFREIWGFAGWNLFGNLAWILNTQGINMLMNMFFGVVVNAARGIADQINGIVLQFVSNFMTALNPQITKSYAAGNKDYAFSLACRGCRFSFYIMYILALPIIIESSQILRLWLGNPPEHADLFLQWTILSTFATLLGNTLVTLQNAHGDIRHYQIWITIFGCVPFPVTWLLFKLGAPSVSAYYIYTLVYWGLIFVRYYLVHSKTGIPPKIYLIGVVLKCHITGLVAALIPILIYNCMEANITRLIIVAITSVMSSIATIYLIGLDLQEKTLVKRMLLKYTIKKLNYEI